MRMLAGLAFPLLFGCAHAAPRARSAAPAASANEAFRAAYRAARGRALAAAGPVLLVDGDRLVLWEGGPQEEAVIRGPRYHALKACAHAPLGIFAALGDLDGPLPRERAAELAGLRRALAALVPTGAREQQIVAASAAEIDRVLQAGATRRADLRAWARGLGPLLSASAAEAARDELETLDQKVRALRAQLGGRWADVHVVVIGAHMARQDEVATAYFLALFGERNEGGRVVYAESLWEPPRALELLGTHLLDGAVGEAFFGDPQRLHRDVLGPGARAHLPTLFP